MYKENGVTMLPKDDALYRQTRKEARRRLRQVQNGRVHYLGPLERLTLSIAGRIDGARSQPREISDGSWSSPLIRKETDALEEHCDRVWGTELVRLEPYHVRIGQLVTDIARLERQLRKSETEDVPVKEEFLAMRKRGEEQLTDAQVCARRQREYDRRVDAARSRTDAVENTLAAHYLELAKLHSIVTDAENEARLCCERVTNHTKQRIDAYWRAALRTHPEQQRMPAYLLPLPETNAERTYFQLHSSTNTAAKGLLEKYRNTVNHEIMEVA